MRRQIADALLATLKAAPGLSGLAVCAKGLRHWKTMEPHELPALFLTRTDSSPKGGWGEPNVWHLSFKVYLFASSDVAADGSAADALDDLIDAAADALEGHPAFGGRQTLGDLVADCRISGTVETDGSTIGGVAVAWFPITVITA